MRRAHRVKAMFHSTAMVPDYDAAVARLGELFGLRVLECHDSFDPAVGRRGGMTWIGDNSLELGQPIVVGAAPDRFVQRTGGGMHSVAVWVDDFAATVAHLEAHGVGVPVRLQGFGFSRPRDLDGLQFEWSEFTVPEDPRAGAPEPPFPVPPVVDVRHHAFVGAVVEDPIATAQRLAAIAGVELLFASEGSLGEPWAALSLLDCALALYPLVPGESQRLWGRAHDRPRVSLLALHVVDLAAATNAVQATGVRLVRHEPGVVVLDPATTGCVEIALVDALLPGDPRL